MKSVSFDESPTATADYRDAHVSTRDGTAVSVPHRQKRRSQRRFANFGIGRKLMASFGIVAALAVGSALIGWKSFDRLGVSFSKVKDTEIPRLKLAHGIKEASAGFAALAPQMASAGEETVIAEIKEQLKDYNTELSEHLKEIRTMAFAVPADMLKNIEDNTEQFIVNLSELEKWVRVRLSFDQGIAAAIANLDSCLRAFQNDIKPVLDRAADRLKAPAGALAVETADFSDYADKARLSAVGNLLAGLLIEAFNTTTVEQLATIGMKYRTASREFEGLLPALSRSGDAAAAASARALLKAGGGEVGPFNQTVRLIEARRRISLLLAANVGAARVLSAEAQKLLDASSAQVESAAKDVEMTRAASSSLLVAIIVIIGAVSFFILWFVVRRGIIVRLDGLFHALLAIARGERDTPIDTRGHDEITDMAEAIEVFKRNAVALQESEARFRDLLGNLMEGVYQIGPDGRLLIANKAMAELLGYPSPAEMIENIGDVANAFYSDYDDYVRLTEALGRDGFVHAFEARLRRVDGTELFGAWNVRTVEDERGQVIRTEGTVSNITDRKLAEEKILQLNARLEERVRQRTAELEATLENLRRAQDELIRTEKLAGLGSLVAGIAHEINTPLGNAVTVTTTLQDKSRSFRKVIDQGQLRRSALVEFMADLDMGVALQATNLNRAAELIGNFKRVAVDQTSDQRRHFDCRVNTQEVFSTLQPMFKQRKIGVNIVIPEGLVLDSYPGAYGQIITNLTTNALTHAFDGRDEGTIRLTAETQDLSTGLWLILRFKDDGIGIPAESLSRIFDPFFTTKFGKGGSGLGLHIVYVLVTRVLGGRVAVESEFGCGTTFEISIPMIAPIGGDGRDMGMAD